MNVIRLGKATEETRDGSGSNTEVLADCTVLSFKQTEVILY